MRFSAFLLAALLLLPAALRARNNGAARQHNYNGELLYGNVKSTTAYGYLRDTVTGKWRLFVMDRFAYDKHRNNTSFMSRSIRYNPEPDTAVSNNHYYTFNDMNQVVEKRYHTIASYTNDSEITTQTYDEYGRLTKSASAFSWVDSTNKTVAVKTLYKYDLHGNIIETSAYNINGSLIERTTSVFDSRGREVGLVHYPGGNRESRKYNSEGQVTEHKYYHADGCIGQWHTYKYDCCGNETERYEYNADGSIKEWRVTEYDADNYRIRYRIYKGDSLNKKITYRHSNYDAHGNFLKEYFWDDDDSKPRMYYKREIEYY